MESREFRTGNLIYDTDENICTVEMITLGSVLLENGAYFFMENLKPIPLTEEWLVKFGFVSNPYQDRYELDHFHIECDKTKGSLDLWFHGCTPYLKHVHSLQNLYFALTGEELEIK